MSEDYPRVQVLLFFKKKPQSQGCDCAQTLLPLSTVRLAPGPPGSPLALHMDILLGRWAGGARGPL